MGFASYTFSESKPPNLVWYHIHLDIIFMSSHVDAMFLALQPLYWHKLECLGPLGEDF